MTTRFLYATIRTKPLCLICVWLSQYVQYRAVPCDWEGRCAKRLQRPSWLVRECLTKHRAFEQGFKVLLGIQQGPKEEMPARMAEATPARENQMCIFSVIPPKTDLSSAKL